MVEFDRRGNLNLVIAVLLVVVLCMGVGLSYLSSRPFLPTMDEQTLELAPADPVLTASESAFVSFVPEGDFSDEQKVELIKKVAYPYRDYVSYIKGDGPVAYLEFHMDSERVENPLFAVALHKAGAQREFPVIVRDGETQWWLPTCSKQKICLFSDTFERTYPEIMQKLSN